MRITERLAEIDRELASFGKTDDVIDDVVRRARAEAPGSLDAIDAVLEALGEAREHAAPGAPGRVETVAPPGAVARPGTWERPERTEPPPEGASGLVEVPEELIRQESLPPVLDLDGIAGSDTTRPDTTPPPAATTSAEELADTGVPDTARHEISKAEVAAAAEGAEHAAPVRDEPPALAALFDDAPEASAAPPEAAGDLADLFDDPRPEPEPGAHQDLSDLLGADLQEALAASPTDDGARPLEGIGDDDSEHTALFTPEDARAIRSSLPPADEAAADGLDAELDALVDEPVAAPAVPSGEFELMIDEDVLELDSVDSDAELDLAGVDGPAPPRPPPPPSAAPPPPPPASQPPPRGLMSRILNRK